MEAPMERANVLGENAQAKRGMNRFFIARFSPLEMQGFFQRAGSGLYEKHG
jgi:hypothetical protein